MNFSLTEDQKMLKTMLRDFAKKELEPVAAHIDETPGEQPGTKFHLFVGRLRTRTNGG